MAQTHDKGIVLTLTGAALLNGTYTAGTSPLNVQTTDQLALFVDLVFDGGGTCTDLRVKVQARRNIGGVTSGWFDLQTVKSSDGTVSNEQAWLRTGGAAQSDMLQIATSFTPDDIQVIAEATGAVGTATDQVKVYLRTVE